MGKLLLGIAAVICLDIAFIAYLYSINDPELEASAKPAIARRPRPPKTVFPPPPNQPSKINEQVEPLGSSVAGEASSLPPRSIARISGKKNRLAAASRKRPAVRTQRDTSLKNLDRNYAISAPPRRSDVRVVKDGKGTTILYKGPQTSADTSTDVYVRPAKSSFASRTVSIVKKPWTWLKAAGSKMF